MILKDLDKPLKTIRGEDIMLAENKAFSKKDAIIIMCEKFNDTAVVGGKLKAYSLGIKVFQAKDTVELSDDEINFLKTMLENEDHLAAVIVGQLLSDLTEQ